MHAAAGTASAQSSSNGQDARSDRISDQEDALDAAAAAIEQRRKPTAPPLGFNVRITTPLYFNSNPREVQANSATALEGDPELELGWSRSLTTLPLKLSARLRADTDRYAGVPQADEDEASATFRAQYYDAADDQALAPFIAYKNTLLFKPTYSPWKQTKNDLAIGLAKLFNFDAGLHPLPPAARSSAGAVWSLSLSTSVQRRLITPGPDSTALLTNISIGYDLAEDWDLMLGLDTTQRWFDTATIRGQTVTGREFTVEPLLTLVWASSGAASGTPIIALQIGFERRSSNLPGRSFAQWAIGPAVTASWRF